MPGTTSEAIAGRLTDAVEATALIALVGSRVYPSKPTQDAALPHVVFWETGGDGMKTLAGRSRLQTYDVRVECYAETEAGAKAVLDEARALLDGWRDKSVGVLGCFASEDADQATLEDATEVSGQTFRLHYIPQ
jgi:hypothetical protein